LLSACNEQVRVVFGAQRGVGGRIVTIDDDHY